MIIIAISLFSVIVLSWLIRYLISSSRVTRSISSFTSQTKISLDSDDDIKSVIDRIKLLYLNGKISKISIETDYIRFEDEHGLNPTWNAYCIKLTSPSVLRYRGFIMRYRVNRAKLNEVLFFLTD
jgi:hypothetical protein